MSLRFSPVTSVVLLAIVLTSACGCHPDVSPRSPSIGAEAPHRVVALHATFEQDLLSLGMVPIAGPKGVDLQHMLTPAQFASVAQVADPPNPEQLVELHPDLILSPPLPAPQRSFYERIAPVFETGFSTGYPWRKRHLEVAGAIHRVAQAKSSLKEYDRRSTALKQELASRNLHPTALIAYVSEDHITVFGHEVNGVQVLDQAGIGRPSGFAGETVVISYERLRALDCDALFIVPSATSNQAALDAIQHQLDLLQAQPLWSSLSVVRKKHVFFVGLYWQLITPWGADQMLADLRAYLLHEPLASIPWPAPAASETTEVGMQ